MLSNSSNFDMVVGDAPIIVNIFNITQFTDSVSLVCGDATGTTFCGPRQLIIWDTDANSEVNLLSSSLFSFDSDLY